MEFHSASVSTVVRQDQELQRLYLFHKKLSSGSFGTVFLVSNKQSNSRSALKVELLDHKTKPTLKKQTQFMKKLQGVVGIPKMLNSGKTDKVMYIQFQILEKDFSWFVLKNINIGLQFLCELTAKLLAILERVHSLGVIHRDLKPQNIMLLNNSVYLIDFGISEVQSSNLKKKRPFVGTPRYANIAAHKGQSQGPSDQIESLVYIMVYLYKKALPWMESNRKLNKIESILDKKVATTKEDLCKGMPQCFLETFNYLKSRKSDAPVDYSFLIDKFVKQLEATAEYDPTNIKDNHLILPIPNKEVKVNRRFSDVTSQVNGLLLKQEQLKSLGVRRQTVQNNLLTVPISQRQGISTASNTNQLLTSERAVASSDIYGMDQSVGLTDELDEGCQHTIDIKIRAHCIPDKMHGGRLSIRNIRTH